MTNDIFEFHLTENKSVIFWVQNEAKRIEVDTLS